jgi:hypothetical protein
VNQFRVNVDEDTAIRVDLGEVDLQWALYISTDNLNWELVPGQGIVDPIFNSVDRRFEIDIPSLAAFPSHDFLKAVAINQGNTDVVFTDLRAIQNVSQSETTENTTYQTDLTLAYKISSTLAATSTVNLLIADEVTNRNLHGNLRWTPSPYAGLSLGASENRQETDTRPDQIDRIYSVTVPTYPLPTLNVTLGGARIESYDGSRKISNIDSYSLNSTAVIYPDLKAAVSLVYATGEREEIIGEEDETESFSGRVTLIARLSRKLNLEITHNYSESLAPTESTAQESTLNLVYRPSDLLVTRLFATKPWTGNETERVDFRADLALLRTRKTRVNFTYRHVHAETETDAFGFISSWDISQIFTLQTQARYFMEEVDSWSISMKLLMNI